MLPDTDDQVSYASPHRRNACTLCVLFPIAFVCYRFAMCIADGVIHPASA